MTDHERLIALVVFLQLTRARRVWLRRDVYRQIVQACAGERWGRTVVLGPALVFPREEFHG